MATITNPKFDPRMTAIPALGIRKLASASHTKGDIPTVTYWRGAIVRDPGATTGDPRAAKGNAYRVDFLFNPSSISISHSASAKYTADQQSTDATYIAAGGIGTVGFTLLFDRTYEVNSPGNTAGDRGVMGDIDALYRVTGAYDVTAKGAAAREIQPMQSYNCFFLFGGTVSNAISYYGYISSLNISYTHFTRMMVPQRCSVEVSVELVQRGDTSGTTSKAAKNPSKTPAPSPSPSPSGGGSGGGSSVPDWTRGR
ncbi:hypothetical protein [Streptomyces sp. NPDC004528]|uniref:CIS tube protein n=1 Tax=Streptomyces sp. NPDC004528 TaxID=3154550 RepID=UPI0033B37E6D